MTNTNLKALADLVREIAESDYLEPDDNAAMLEAAALLTALAAPLGEEPDACWHENKMSGASREYVSAEYADYWRVACLQARAECAELKSANSLGQSLLSEAHAKINELAALKQEQSQ